jgi:hypothetical protein
MLANNLFMQASGQEQINKNGGSQMTEDKVVSRKDALADLKRFGITGEQVYMIDFIPLIEVMWADGQVQKGELAVLNEYIEKHVANVNQQAGCKVLNIEQAQTFVNRFLVNRPSPEIMKTLRRFVKPLRLASANEKDNQQLRDSLLCTCMDIASSAVTEYPYHFQERFSPAEKNCFFSILESLSASEQQESKPVEL